MRKSVIMLSVLIFYTLIHSSASIAGWVEIVGTTFFDPSNIEYTKRDTILVWMKNSLKKSDIYKFQIKANDFIKPYDKQLDRSFFGYNGDYSYHNYSDYSFSIQRFEYDCKKKLVRLLIEYDYDKNNIVINRTYDFESRFTYIASNSKNEYILNEVCDFANNTENKSGLYQQHHSLPEVPTTPKEDKGSGLPSTKPGQ